MRRETNQRTYKDPVCGMEISHRTATEQLSHNGKIYYFCAPTCREAFVAAPDGYLQQHRQHGMKLD